MRGALLAVAILWSGCAPKSGRQNDTLTIYSAGPRALAESICQSFTSNTGVRVDLFQATTGQLLARLEAEKYRPRADVVILAGEVPAVALKQQGRLARVRPADADKINREWCDPDDAYWPSAASLVGVAVRKEFADRAPDRWSDWFAILDARRVVMPSPSRSGATGDFVVGLALELGNSIFPGFARLRLHGMDFAAANNQAIQGLQMGVYDALIGAVDYLIYQQIQRGEPIEMRYPIDGAVLVTRPIAILATSNKRDLAQRFVDHYMGTESQARVAKSFLIPARRDVPPHPLRGQVPERLIRPDPEQAAARQATLLRKFQYEIERVASQRALLRVAGEGN